MKGEAAAAASKGGGARWQRVVAGMFGGGSRSLTTLYAFFLPYSCGSSSSGMEEMMGKPSKIATQQQPRPEVVFFDGGKGNFGSLLVPFFASFWQWFDEGKIWEGGEEVEVVLGGDLDQWGWF